MIILEIIYKNIKDLKPYLKNARKNDKAVKYVAKSIEEFGFKVPVIIDKDGVIVCGHTRYKASKKLGYNEIPCIIADDLTEEQIKAFSDVYCNRKNARAESKAIMSVVNKYLKN